MSLAPHAKHLLAPEAGRDERVRVAIALAHHARALRQVAMEQLGSKQRQGVLYQLARATMSSASGEAFADALAQSLSCALFAAKWRLAKARIEIHSFTRHLAANALPAGSPFLETLIRPLLRWPTGDGLDWLLSRLDQQAAHLEESTLEDLEGQEETQRRDPFSFFFQTFLSAYDEGQRHRYGVYETPAPLLSFLVRGLHTLLQQVFGLAEGLADTATWGEMFRRHPTLEASLPRMSNLELDRLEMRPFVTILDPATGTGGFLLEALSQIRATLEAKWTAAGLSSTAQEAAWQAYLSLHLRSRLFACELLPAPYAVACVRLASAMGLPLHPEGLGAPLPSDATGAREVGIYLANALEAEVSSPSLAKDAMALEARAMTQLFHQKRFTVVLGNPPYAGISANRSPSLERLLAPYYRVDGANIRERKVWLQDDYVKFFRLAQRVLERTGVGLLAYITNHGYLSNPTFRGMRQSLLGTFSGLRFLDLHGSALKRERPPQGVIDRNLFEIRQGVALCFGVRDPQSQGARSAPDAVPSGLTSSSVVHADLWGTQTQKEEWLSRHTLETAPFAPLQPKRPTFFFFPSDGGLAAHYELFFPLQEAMPVHGAGFITARDRLVVALEEEELKERMQLFADLSRPDDEIRAVFFADRRAGPYLPGDTRGWRLPEARRRVAAEPSLNPLVNQRLMRPFDHRAIFYTDYMIDWPRPELSRHLEGADALALLTTRITKDPFAALVSRHLPGHKSLSAYDITYVFPLRVKEETPEARTWNFSPSFLRALAEHLGLPMAPNSGLPLGVSGHDVFFYLYAVLYSRTYRDRYRGFLKVDFPRIPLPPSLALFRRLSSLGERLCSLHLLEAPADAARLPLVLGGPPLSVEKVTYEPDRIFLDRRKRVGFASVPEPVWAYRLGGSQVCSRWLRERRGRVLSEQAVESFRRIVAVLSETLEIEEQIEGEDWDWGPPQ